MSDRRSAAIISDSLQGSMLEWHVRPFAAGTDAYSRRCPVAILTALSGPPLRWAIEGGLGEIIVFVLKKKCIFAYWFVLPLWGEDGMHLIVNYLIIARL